jgi:hypothetical protein
MNDKAKILVGVAVFLVVAAFPVWRTFGVSAGVAPPKLDLPTQSSRCVEDKAYMNAYHMDLLNQWRDAVVRQDQKQYTASNGAKYDMSLTRTCLSMKCHSNTDKFCNRCHTYANVAPTCWNCHVAPEGN